MKLIREKGGAYSTVEVWDCRLTESRGDLDNLSFSSSDGDWEGAHIGFDSKIFVPIAISLENGDYFIDCETYIGELSESIIVELGFHGLTLREMMQSVINTTQTGWRLAEFKDSGHVANLETITYETAHYMMLEICKVFESYLKIDELNKLVYVYPLVDVEPTVAAVVDENDVQVKIDSLVSQLATRLIPLGKWNLTIDPVNDGVRYLSSGMESTYGVIVKKFKTDISSRADLKKVGELKLKQLSSPRRSIKIENLEKSVDVGEYIYLATKWKDCGGLLPVYRKETTFSEFMDRTIVYEVGETTLEYSKWEAEINSILNRVVEREDEWSGTSQEQDSMLIEYGSAIASPSAQIMFENEYYGRPTIFASVSKDDEEAASLPVQPIYTEFITSTTIDGVRVFSGCKIKGLTANMPGYRINVQIMAKGKVGG